MRLVLIWACQVALVVTGLTVIEAAQVVSPPAVSAAVRPPDDYRPRPGVRFSDPYSRDPYSKNTIKSHIMRTINSMARGSHIRIASWNVRGEDYKDALIAAHDRGVIVQVVMGQQNGPPTTPNPDVRYLRNHLNDGNAGLPWAKRSWLRYCEKSCRGFGGIAHSKFMLFDSVQDVPDVIMYGSANVTQLAADVQWNDLYTLVRRPQVFDSFVSVFDQMSKDTAMGSAYRDTPLTVGKEQIGTIGFYPYTGQTEKEIPDPILGLLNKTRCSGATGGKGINGHTKIRIAQDALWGQRGLDIAERLATMARRGCNIKIVYTLFGNEVLRVLRKAGIPLVHLAYDTDRDGEYDHYLHMKAMAISGVVGAKTDATIVTNGSANWTELPLHSDEVTGQIADDLLTHDYVTFIDWMFDHRPADWVAPDLAPVQDGEVVTDGRRVITDPYRLIRQDL